MTLRQMRKRAGLTQQDLLRAIGMRSISHVWAWEAWDAVPRPSSARNPRLMRLDTAARMANALGVTLDDFWNGL